MTLPQRCRLVPLTHTHQMALDTPVPVLSTARPPAAVPQSPRAEVTPSEDHASSRLPDAPGTHVGPHMPGLHMPRRRPPRAPGPLNLCDT